MVPLVGPSSLLLALMASGLNGQSFAFHGYLPVDEEARKRRIRELEAESARHSRTQLFIETPYRNDRMFEALKATCGPETRLCVARDLTTADGGSPPGGSPTGRRPAPRPIQASDGVPAARRLRPAGAQRNGLPASTLAARSAMPAPERWAKRSARFCFWV